MVICTVCGEWYPMHGRDVLDICPPCWDNNFAQANPPLDGPALEVPELRLSPRQVSQLLRIHSRTQRRQEEP